MTESLSNFEATDRKSFIQFIELLREDLLKNPSTWENRDLKSFLEAIAGYTEDIQGYYDHMGQKIDVDTASWQLIADIFKGATLYE